DDLRRLERPQLAAAARAELEPRDDQMAERAGEPAPRLASAARERAHPAVRARVERGDQVGVAVGNEAEDETVVRLGGDQPTTSPLAGSAVTPSPPALGRRIRYDRASVATMSRMMTARVRPPCRVPRAASSNAGGRKLLSLASASAFALAARASSSFSAP